MSFAAPPQPSPARTLDVRGKACPIPVARAAQTIGGMAQGEILEVLATDPDVDLDVRAWTLRFGHELLSLERAGEEFLIRVRRA
jgi:tRNA 2-thiouridine synthesizing protein A